MQKAYLSLNNVPQFVGNQYFVDPALGNDASDGKSPDTAKATVTGAYAECIAGDRIVMKQGTVTENVTIALDGVELIGEQGATIAGLLTVTGDAVVIKNIGVIRMGASPTISLEGDVGFVSDVFAMTTGANAFEITGSRSSFKRCVAAGYATSGFAISGSNNRFNSCDANGSNNAVKGFVLSGVATNNTLTNCISKGNATNSISVTSSSEANAAIGFNSLAGDGAIFGDLFLSDFHFENKKHTHLTLNAGDVIEAGVSYYNLFKITGAVRINRFTIILDEAVTGSTVEDLGIDLASYTSSAFKDSENVSLFDRNITTSLGLAGSVLEKNRSATNALDFISSHGVNVDQAESEKNYSFMCVEDKDPTAENTYIRLGHNENAAITGGVFTVQVEWEPISRDGSLAVV